MTLPNNCPKCDAFILGEHNFLCPYSEDLTLKQFGQWYEMASPEDKAFWAALNKERYGQKEPPEQTEAEVELKVRHYRAWLDSLPEEERARRMDADIQAMTDIKAKQLIAEAFGEDYEEPF